MKKLLVSSIIYVALCFLPLFSQIAIPFILQGSLGSGFISYGSPFIEQKVNSATENAFARSLISLDLTTGIAVNQYVYITFSPSASFDLFAKEKHYMRIIEYTLAAGARVYPFAGGLSIGFEYGTGSRFFSETMNNITYNENSPWGLGWRILLEYDFGAGKRGVISPTVGLWYRNLSIDSVMDHTTALFVRFSFR